MMTTNPTTGETEIGFGHVVQLKDDSLVEMAYFVNVSEFSQATSEGLVNTFTERRKKITH